MDAAFWRGRRVFITGHTGFKGSWLALWLQHLGAHVTGYALEPSTQPALFELAQVARGMDSVVGNVKDVENLRYAIARARPTAVFHLAAQSLVRRSYDDPVETYATNFMGTVNLLEAVRGFPEVRAVVMVTSDKCYENPERVEPFCESDALGGRDPYSSSKACAEIAISAYRTSFFQSGAAVASARAGNVIGGGDWARDRLVPDVMRAIEEKVAVRLRNPESVRPWQHVLEPLHGYLMLAERLHAKGCEFASAWNFGPRDEDCQPVRRVVEQLADACGGLHWEAEKAQGPHEASYLKLDSAKARTELGWKPRWDVATALRSVAQWHRAYRDGRDMCAVTLAQVDEYTGAK